MSEVHDRALKAYVLSDAIAALRAALGSGYLPWDHWPTEMDARLRDRDGYLELLEAAHEDVFDAIEAQYRGLPPLPGEVPA